MFGQSPKLLACISCVYLMSTDEMIISLINFIFNKHIPKQTCTHLPCFSLGAILVSS